MVTKKYMALCNNFAPNGTKRIYLSFLNVPVIILMFTLGGGEDILLNQYNSRPNTLFSPDLFDSLEGYNHRLCVSQTIRNMKQRYRFLYHMTFGHLLSIALIFLYISGWRIKHQHINKIIYLLVLSSLKITGLQNNVWNSLYYPN